MDALSFGLSPTHFWRLSLRELWNIRRAVRDRQRVGYERDVVLAWQVERVSILAMERDGGRRLPALTTLLPKAPSAKREGQTREELVHTLHVLSAQYRIPLRVTPAPAVHSS